MLLGGHHLRRLIAFRQNLRIKNLLEPRCHLLRARPIHVLDEQIACHSPKLRVGLQDHRHGVQGFLTLGHVAWAGRDHHVVGADAGVVDLFDQRAHLVADFLNRFSLRWVELDHIDFAINADDAGDALRVVNLRDHVHDLPGDVADRTGQVVHVMVRTHVALLLAGEDGLTRAFIALHPKAGVVLARCTLNVVSSPHLGLDQAGLGQRRRRALGQGEDSPGSIRHVGIDLQIRPIGRIGSLPLHLVAFELAAIANEGCLGSQRQHLGFLARPVVVHALGVLGVPHKAADVHLAVNFPLVADDAHDRNPLAGPLALLQHVEAVGLHPHDLLAVNFAAADRLAEHGRKLLVLRRAAVGSLVVRVQVQRGFFVGVVEIFRDADRVFLKPRRNALIAHALAVQRADRRRVREHPLIFFFENVLGDEAPLSVGAARVLDRRVHVDAERVADAPDADVLIERLVVAVFRQQADVALAVGHLVVAGGVVGHVGVRHILNVPHHAVENLSHLHVGVVVRRDDLAAGPVLALLVRHLTDVLRQLVDRQARTRVDRLALHRPAGGQHVGGPLPLVVRAAGHEPQIVQFVLTAVRVRRLRHLQAVAHGRHLVVVARRHLLWV